MILLIDGGNTTLGIGVRKDNQIEVISRISTPKLKEKNLLIDIFKKIDYPITDVFTLSVVPSINDKIIQASLDVFHLKPIFVNINMRNDIKILLDNPQELGTDLYIDIYASKLHYDKSIIIDLGTATKILVVDQNVFLGGAIVPGLIGSFNSLFSTAELLNSVEITKPQGVIGNSTHECLISGLIVGHATLIEGMVKKIKDKYGISNVLLTGGNSIYIKDELTIDYKYVPDLIFEGLQLLYDTRNKD